MHQFYTIINFIFNYLRKIQIGENKGKKELRANIGDYKRENTRRHNGRTGRKDKRQRSQEKGDKQAENCCHSCTLRGYSGEYIGQIALHIVFTFFKKCVCNILTGIRVFA